MRLLTASIMDRVITRLRPVGLAASTLAALACSSGDIGTSATACTAGGAQCGAGQTCSAEGHCVSNGGGEGGEGGSLFDPNGTSTGSQSGDGGSGAGNSCADVQVTFEKVIPTVVLLVDQSGSMTTSFGSGSRWSVLHDTLMDPNTGIVKKLDQEVRFGLALYSGDGGSNCPMLTQVSIALGNYAQMASVYDPATPAKETPTGESIDAVVAGLAPFAETGPKYIILATDGEPDTCAEPNPQNGQPQAIAAAQAAYAQGIGTFIVAVGDEVSAGHQQDMANAGAGLPIGGSQNAPFWTALDPQGLVDAFDTIVNGVRSCVFSVDGSIDPAQAGKGTVKLDGQPLGYDEPNGWKLNSPTEIELVGAACDALQDGDHEVSATFPCGAAIPDPK